MRGCYCEAPREQAFRADGVDSVWCKESSARPFCSPFEILSAWVGTLYWSDGRWSANPRGSPSSRRISPARLM